MHQNTWCRHKKRASSLPCSESIFFLPFAPALGDFFV
nr:MAG TPA: hypothetical protein [Caudoviricetes sp.]